MINFEILFFFQKYKSVSIISRFYFSFKHKCNNIRNSNFIFIVLFKHRKQRLIVDVFLFLMSFKNQIEIWVTNWENLKNRILIFDIKNFFDFETMFVEKFLIVDRKWTLTFFDNWIMQKKTIEKNVHFEETIREYKNAAKKRLKIVKHVNVVILQNQSQSQSKKSTSSICSDQHENSDKTRQCICECMHDWNKCDHIRKSIKSLNWKCNSQEKKWAKKAIKNSRWLYFKIKNMTNIDILNEIKSKDCKNDKIKKWQKIRQWKESRKWYLEY